MEKQIFQFTNYDVPVEIAGHSFTLNCSADTGDYIKAAAGKLRELANQVAAGEKNNADIVEYGMGVVDHLLGAGAAEKILEGRDAKNRTSDVMDLCRFMVEIAAKFRNERQKSTQPRPHRRKKKK